MGELRTSEENAEPREWLIRKRGYYYRPDRAGYTASVDEAGRYTETEAKAEAAIQPSIMSAVHQSTVGGTSPVALTSNERFASVLPTADELKMLREAYAETYPVRPLLNEIDRLQKSVDTLNAANRFLSEQLESERVAHETPGELEQLRRIDKAARAFVDACEHKVRIPNGLFAELCDALFDGRPSQETLPCSWQPIETAPKDGSKIMLGYFPEPVYEGASTHESQEIAFWHGVHQQWCGRVLLNAYGPFSPTHWRRLFEPPAQKADEHPPCVWRSGCKHPEVCSSNNRCVPGGIEGQS